MTKNLTNVVYIKQNRVLTDSRHLAEVFGKRHADVIRATEEQLKDLPEEFRQRNFALSSFTSATGNGTVREFPMYELTYDAFNLIAMSFNGKRALAFKVEYIKEFNRRGEELEKRGIPAYSTEELLEMSLAEIKKLKTELKRAEVEIIDSKNNAATILNKECKGMSLWMQEFKPLRDKAAKLKLVMKNPGLCDAARLTIWANEVMDISKVYSFTKKTKKAFNRYDRATILKLVEIIEKGG